MLRHYGYKPVFIFGLCLYGVGALLMWPGVVYQSFGGFCGATFVIGSGLGSLETAANPYLAVCGPPRYSEIRINFAQAFNGIGTVVGPVLGSYAFFKNVGDGENALKNVVSLLRYLYRVCQIMAAPNLASCLGFIRHLVSAIQVLSTDNKPAMGVSGDCMFRVHTGVCVLL